MTKKSNCLFWAWKQQKKCGGYICFRNSKFWKGFHVLWLRKEGEKMQHFVPVKRFYDGRRLRWWQCLKLLRFDGIIKVGDSEDK